MEIFNTWLEIQYKTVEVKTKEIYLNHLCRSHPDYRNIFFLPGVGRPV